MSSGPARDKNIVSVDYFSGLAFQLKILSDNCIQLWRQTSGGLPGLEKIGDKHANSWLFSTFIH